MSARTLALHVHSHSSSISHQPRHLILQAAKECFARKSVEATSLNDISRAAGVSEAELKELYGSKTKLLLAILDEGWAAINPRIADIIATSPDPRSAMTSILSTAAHVMQKDRTLVRLMLLEAYRPNPMTNQVAVSRGYQVFIEMVTALAERGQQQGYFKASYHPRVIVSLLTSVGQGVLRDALIVEEQGGSNPYSMPQLMAAFEAIVASLRP